MPLHVSIPKLPPSFYLPTSTPRFLADLLLSLSATSSAAAAAKGSQLHGHLLKSGLIPSISLLSNHLITFYARCHLPHLSRLAFLDSPSKTSAVWASLIAALAQNGLSADALLAFRSMLSHSIPVCDRTLPSATKSCAALSLPGLARSLHSLALRSPFSSDVFVASSIIDMYSKCSLLTDARAVFDEMPHRNVVSWSSLIYGHALAGLNLDALHLFKLALADNLINDFTYSTIIRVCSAAPLLDLGTQIHAHCSKSIFMSSPFVGSSLISLYSKSGLVDDAYKLFDEMPEKNLGAWNAVLIASAQHGHIRTAFDRFTGMERAGHTPNFITFLCLLTACSHAGLVDDGKRYFNLMISRGIEPEEQHYACMVDLFSRVGRLKEAMDFIKTMPLAPTESVWGALLTGCRIHKDTDTAAFAAGKLFETCSSAGGSGAHMLLANAYAAAGRYTDAARARKEMRDRGIKKETGLSWVEHEGKVHTFVSDDTCHYMIKEIHEVVNKLGERMEKEGYVVDTSCVLRDVDGEEKRRAVWYHSERLAIGFGLLSVGVGRPIRVMKNLRVCGDCHTAIKFVSKVTERVVILRDNNRFHRFEDGVCSCGDYW
ncbi:putative pentatricopeptide repeat-containing protein At5g52630 [Dioscorea cayenensis subsp. rotundata]|uniref:Pentatricopeptide repeat-containing protein At5g52630 n=1 Tax=Dioscorea cayennensis subsp. rotundata TaxID=55577 RepID=A0AB40ASK2_DIOCR|nr:putative pentatricopeptide repeat-containing protein At5g52630 [Dioscorea cayenensis subsp. rotundata]